MSYRVYRPRLKRLIGLMCNFHNFVNPYWFALLHKLNFPMHSFETWPDRNSFTSSDNRTQLIIIDCILILSWYLRSLMYDFRYYARYYALYLAILFFRATRHGGLISQADILPGRNKSKETSAEWASLLPVACAYGEACGASVMSASRKSSRIRRIRYLNGFPSIETALRDESKFIFREDACSINVALARHINR